MAEADRQFAVTMADADVVQQDEFSRRYYAAEKADAAAANKVEQGTPDPRNIAYEKVLNLNKVRMMEQP